MKDIIISFKVNEAMRDWLKTEAAKKDISVSWLIRDILKNAQ